MKDLKISELIEMQEALSYKMREQWTPKIPENGHFMLLYMFEEMVEIVAILKKRGDNAVMDDRNVRAAFIEELSDTLMYYIDLMRCYGISAEELSEAFLTKHEKNMPRDFEGEHGNYLK